MSLLTPTEEAIIKGSWAPVSDDLKGYGIKLFLHFFKLHPEYQKHFKSFADVPYDQLAGNKRLAAHGYTVMNAINGIVDTMDDPEVLTELLVKTGQRHYKRNLTVADFKTLAATIIDFLQVNLGAGFTPEVKAAWEKVLGLIVTHVGIGLAKAAAGDE